MFAPSGTARVAPISLIIPSLIRMSPLTPRREPASEMRASRISTYPGWFFAIRPDLVFFVGVVFQIARPRHEQAFGDFDQLEQRDAHDGEDHHGAERHRCPEESHRGLDQVAKAGIRTDEFGDYRPHHA